MADVSSVQAIEHIWREHVEAGGTIYLSGLQPQVRNVFERAGLIREIGEQHFFWSAADAINRIAELASHAEAETSPQEPPTESLDEFPLGISTA